MIRASIHKHTVCYSDKVLVFYRGGRGVESHPTSFIPGVDSSNLNVISPFYITNCTLGETVRLLEILLSPNIDSLPLNWGILY
jgi:hypothetical protein